MKIIKAPEVYTLDKPSVFLAGSIEQGKAIDWQAQAAGFLTDLDIIVLNPRREAWDETWEESMRNQTLREQIEWELTALEKADVVLFNFLPDTYSPISLLELGLFAHKKVFVCCPDEYWREPNVEMVCQRYHIPFFQDLEKMMQEVKNRGWISRSS